jgi:hypothetical protein
MGAFDLTMHFWKLPIENFCSIRTSGGQEVMGNFLRPQIHGVLIGPSSPGLAIFPWGSSRGRLGRRDDPRI